MLSNHTLPGVPQVSPARIIFGKDIGETKQCRQKRVLETARHVSLVCFIRSKREAMTSSNRTDGSDHYTKDKLT